MLGSHHTRVENKNMSKVYVLEAETSVQKTIDLGTKQKTQSVIPFRFTSSAAEIATIDQFYKLLESLQSAPNKCLIKGELVRHLYNESRAGATDASLPTHWVCLDLDGYQGAKSPHEFLQQIGISDTSYVYQHSSSSGIKKGLNGHIFMMLEDPAPPRVLKNWLRQLNYSVEPLVQELSLTRTMMSLRHKLDITTCQNDKLIFTAPPKITNGKDPIRQRLELVKGIRPTLPVPTAECDKELQRHAHKIVNKLRETVGAPTRRFRSCVEYKGYEVCPNPTVATVTGEKTERGYTYLNLNGGDSWGYYHPEDNCELVFNFKGEPAYKTKELIPDYYAKKATPGFEPKAIIHMGFRDMYSGGLFIGSYDPQNHDLELYQSPSESALRQYLEQNNTYLGDIVPTWRLSWSPHEEPGPDIEAEKVNCYRPSDLSKATYQPPGKSHPLKVPPALKKLIHHVMGGDDEVYEHFQQWMACLIQTQDKVGTAWLLHGTQGTGKNMLIHQVIAPMLGPDNVFIGNADLMLSEFNAFLARKLLIFIDEADTDGLSKVDKSRVERRMKEMITNAELPVRRMFQNAVVEKNYANLIFASNKAVPITVAEDDRRINVAVYQTQPLPYEYHHLSAQIKEELPEYYRFLKYYPYDENRARKPLRNTARAILQGRSIDSHTSLKRILEAGEIRVLIEQLPSPKLSDAQRVTTLGPKAVVYDMYRQLMIDILEDVHCRQVSREDLMTIWHWCNGFQAESPMKFSAFMNKLGLEIIVMKKKNRSFRGIRIKRWDITQEQADQLLRLFREGAL